MIAFLASAVHLTVLAFLCLGAGITVDPVEVAPDLPLPDVAAPRPPRRATPPAGPVYDPGGIHHWGAVAWQDVLVPPSCPCHPNFPEGTS